MKENEFHWTQQKKSQVSSLLSFTNMTNSECLLTPHNLQSGILFLVIFFVNWGKKFSFRILLKKNAWLQVNHCTWLMDKPYSYLYLLLPQTHCLSAVHIFLLFHTHSPLAPLLAWKISLAAGLFHWLRTFEDAVIYFGLPKYTIILKVTNIIKCYIQCK